MSRSSPEGSLGPWPEFFWRVLGLVPAAEGRFLQVSVHSPKSLQVLRLHGGLGDSHSLPGTFRGVSSVCPSWLGMRGRRRPGAPGREPAPLVLGTCRGGAVPAVSCLCHTHTPGMGAGMDVDKGLPTAPQPGAALTGTQRCFSPDRPPDTPKLS